MTSQWLSAGGDPNYPLDKLYVWTAGSWDALGVHFASADAGGSWADAQIIDTVKQHNAKV